MGIRQTDSIHSMNQRIHSQIAAAQSANVNVNANVNANANANGQVWGSYGRSVKTDASNSVSDVDTSVLAKLTLNPTPTTTLDHSVDYKTADYR